MEIVVDRDRFTETFTMGMMFLNDQLQCYSGEDKVREQDGLEVSLWKVKGETAIPRGRYRVVLAHSERFGRLTPHVLDVPGFSAIEIHPGNTEKDTEGCILVGEARDEHQLLNSREAFDKLMEALGTLPPTEMLWLNIG